MRSDTGRLVERDSPLSPGAELAPLRKFKVPKQEQGELLAVLGPMKRDIVTR